MSDSSPIRELHLRRGVAGQRHVSVDDVAIDTFEVAPASDKGDNFSCQLFQVTGSARVLEQPHNFDFVLKCMPANAYKIQFISDINGFQRECDVYRELIPLLEDLIRRNSQMTGLDFPKCFYASMDDGVIVMENLRSQGFHLMKSKSEMTIHLMEQILASLANFHAAGYHYIKLNPDLGDDLTYSKSRGWFDDAKDQARTRTESFMMLAVPRIIEVVEHFGTESERDELIERLNAFEKRRQSTVSNAFLPLGKLDVFVHNDLWMNNILFDNSANVKLVDLQFVKWSRPAIDLCYLLCTSLEGDLRIQHFQHLMRHYYNCLSLQLANFGYNISQTFSFEDCLREYDDCFAFGLVMGFLHLQMELIPMDGNDGFDYDEVTSAESMQDMQQRADAIHIRQAKKDPQYVANVLILVREAAQRKVI